MVISLAVTIMILTKSMFSQFSTSSFDKEVLYSMLKKGLTYGFSFLVIVANYKIDIFMLDKMSSTTQVGLYSVAVQFGELLWQLPSAVVVVMLSRMANRSKYSDVAKEINVNSFYTFWVTFFGSVFLYMFGGFVIPVIFGFEYSVSSDILNLLLPGLVMMVLFKIVNSYFAGDGRPMTCLYFMIPALFINVICNYILIPELGASGAAISSSISYCFCSLAIWVYFCRKFNFPLFSFLVKV